MERVLEAIIEKFSLYPEKTALHWLGEECNVVDSYTYADLDRRTKEIARGLIDVAQKNKKQPQRGQRAVMYYNPGLDFILNFLGCLRAGVIPGNFLFFVCLALCMHALIYKLADNIYF